MDGSRSQRKAPGLGPSPRMAASRAGRAASEPEGKGNRCTLVLTDATLSTVFSKSTFWLTSFSTERMAEWDDFNQVTILNDFQLTEIKQ